MHAISGRCATTSTISANWIEVCIESFAMTCVVWRRNPQPIATSSICEKRNEPGRSSGRRFRGNRFSSGVSPSCVGLVSAWLHIVSRRSIEPGIFQALVALVGLIQLVDDLLDWKDDWACRRPTYVTAFSAEFDEPVERVGITNSTPCESFRGSLLLPIEIWRRYHWCWREP